MKKVQKKAPVGKIPAPLTREQEIEATSAAITVIDEAKSKISNEYKALDDKLRDLKERRSLLLNSLEYEKKALVISIAL